MTENPATTMPIAANGHNDGASVAHTANDPESLRLYTKIKLALAAQLRALHEAIKRRGDKIRLQQCDDLTVKLAEDRFTLAVLGQFKRGKSSLMNAIIGRELLPVGVLPLTSAITVLRFGPRERLIITRSDVKLVFPEEYSVDRLPEFVTEKENPGNRKHVKTACIEMPVPFLRRGLEFVDTPGVGSAIEANTETTLKFLPECDAVLFVTSVDSPFTRVELEFLETIRQYVRKFFFVINKTDLLGTNERSDVLDYVRNIICKHTGTDDVKVFPVSARLGLAGKLEGGWSKCVESGLSDLENALARFLSGEKASVFLAAVADRALWLCGQESIEVGLRERANELSEKERLERINTLAGKLADGKEERRRIFQSLRQRIISEVHLALVPELRAVVRSETDGFPGCVERHLNHAAWFPLACEFRNIERAAFNSISGNIWKWLQGHADKLNFASDESVRREWDRIQSNLTSLPAVAADVFGLPGQAQTDGNGGHPQEPLGLDVKFDTPFLAGWQWNIPVSRTVAILPVFLVREHLKHRLQTGISRMAEKLERAAIEFAINCVGKALDTLEKEVENRAEQISHRILIAVKARSDSDSETRDNLPVNDSVDEISMPAIRGRLLAIRREIASRSGGEAGVPPVVKSGILPGENEDRSTERTETLAPTPRVKMPTSRSDRMPIITTPDFSRDLKTRACPCCDHLRCAGFEFFSHYQYDLATYEATQEEFAELLGFCPLHTWQLEAISCPVGASIGFAKLAERVSQLLAAKAKSPLDGHAKVKLVRDSTECHVCRLLREKEREYLRHLAAFIETPQGRSAYARSHGVCLRHLGLCLPFLNGAETARFILEEASRRFEQMSEDMQSFSMKTEALRRQLRNSDESDAYLRAITHLVGTSANCQPMNKEAAEI